MYHVLFSLVIAFTVLFGSVQAVEVAAKGAVLFHPKTGTFVIEQNADSQFGPASLTKIMTAYLLFEAIEKGVVSLESELPISEAAWRKGGSKMFLEVGKTAKVEDLIKGILVSSGNDACIVVAEYLGGSEAMFAKRMTQKARELGMNNSTFTNASGWPDPNMKTTARDMAILAASIMRDFPQFYGYFSLPEFTYSGIKQTNRNRLLGRNVGVDGLKTGHTNAAGYHLVASAAQRGERLISVVLGTDSFNAREGENLKLLRYGLSNYATKNLLATGQELTSVAVWQGDARKVSLQASQGLTLFLNKFKNEKVTAKLSYNSPLMAPLQKGDNVGEMLVSAGGKTYTMPLLAGETVERLGFFARIGALIKYNLGWK